MLSRTADHLFWMARYTERAENTARMLDVNVQTALLPQSTADSDRAWRSMLGISELLSRYEARFGNVLVARQVLDFMVRDPENPSSIYCCLQAARENARAVRGTLTTEVWETQNDTWLELQRQLKSKVLDTDPSAFFEWVKFRSHLSRGVTLGTMLSDEAFYFIRLGTHLERADNTARILDVKFHGAEDLHLDYANSARMRALDQTDAQRDFYHWAAVLRSVSAFEVYRKVYRDVITPERVAELLILNKAMPRSLASCMNEVQSNLERVSNVQSDETERRAGLLAAELSYGRIDDVFHTGLHAYLTSFLEKVGDLGNRISRDFLVPLVG
ncbi:alpha-E domain-containing protein [Derxia gummosa]|uniref:Alpha-E domain-containing protein n=1 Tax=Derxia gummosa DSM 723 TaxID=1121388 RepID=A0A8B6X7R2_9BURK|nr:alpha-E domain-containing protein [Derxia gummosa]